MSKSTQSFEENLATYKIHHKDLDVCFNDAVAVAWLVSAHNQALQDARVDVYTTLKKRVELALNQYELPEAGYTYGMPILELSGYKKAFKVVIEDIDQRLKEMK